MYLPQTKNKIQMVLGQVSDYLYIIYVCIHYIHIILYYVCVVTVLLRILNWISENESVSLDGI